MERLTEKITNIKNGEVLAYRLKSAGDRIKADRKLGQYEDAEEKGLLRLKVWMIGRDCSAPEVQDGCMRNCEQCHFNRLMVKEAFIEPSGYDKSKHFIEMDKAFRALNHARAMDERHNANQNG